MFMHGKEIMDLRLGFWLASKYPFKAKTQESGKACSLFCFVCTSVGLTENIVNGEACNRSPAWLSEEGRN